MCANSEFNNFLLTFRGSDFQKYFVLNNIREIRTFNGVNSEFDNCFHKLRSKMPFWGKLDEKV